jgi:hypothetical protein
VRDGIRAVDPGREIGDRPVPAHGNRARPGDRLVAVHEVELELRSLADEAVPVAVEDGAVVVVLRQRVARRRPRPLDEVRR